MPRDFGETDDFAVGNIGDVGTADKWQQMMFAHRIKLDVFDHNDLARVGIEDRAINHVLDTVPVPLGEKLKRARGAARCSRDPADADLRRPHRANPETNAPFPESTWREATRFNVSAVGSIEFAIRRRAA